MQIRPSTYKKYQCHVFVEYNGLINEGGKFHSFNLTISQNKRAEKNEGQLVSSEHENLVSNHPDLALTLQDQVRTLAQDQIKSDPGNLELYRHGIAPVHISPPRNRSLSCFPGGVWISNISSGLRWDVWSGNKTILSPPNPQNTSTAE